MSSSAPPELFGEQYFRHGCGPVPYERNAEWLGHFSRVAEMVARTINPATVLDAGCALGFLVEALRDRGIEAFGIDISTYAIARVREDIRPFCQVASLTAPLPRRYDLIISIEVLEHLPKDEGMRALAVLCEATDDIVFSSSPDDYTESTHFNVQPPDYWAAAFANHGFRRDVDFDGYLIAPWAVRFRRSQESLEQTIRNYERKLWPLNKQVGILRQSLVEKTASVQQQAVQLQDAVRQHRAELEQQLLLVQELEQQLLLAQQERHTIGIVVNERDEQLATTQALLAQEKRTQQTLRQTIDEQAAEHQRIQRKMVALELDRHHLADRLARIEGRRSWQMLEKAWEAQMRLAPPASYQGRAWLALTRLARRGVGIDAPRSTSSPGLTDPAKQHGDEALASEEEDDFHRARAYNSYEGWVARCEQLRYNRPRVEQEIAEFSYRPTISIIMPTYNSPAEYLRAAIDSVVAQYYPNWELCICDDASPDEHVRDILSAYATQDERVRVVFSRKNSGIGGASNEAIALATGEYIGLLDHDDVLTPDALFEVVNSLQEVRADFIYSDEDKIDTDGRRCDPFLKPSWSPDLLLTCMYTSHFSVYRRSIVNEIGGFRLEVNGSQDYDLALRLTERAASVTHVPKILYHWRKIPGSAAASIEAKPYAYLAAQQALTDTLERRKIAGSVEIANAPGYYHVRREVDTMPKVSILIPTRDRLELLARCIKSIEEQTEYRHYEIIIIDNASREATTAAYLARTHHRVIHDDGAFNYSRLNNRGASEATGEYLLLLNNDTEVLSPSWLTAMLEQAQRPEVGAVGAKLLYPDGLIQHAGVILGLGGVAGHAQRYVDGFTGTGYFNYANSLKNYSAITGACLMVRKELFDRIGGLDEQNLPINFNDVDFCLRLREQGLLIIYTPYALLRHAESATREPVVDEMGRQYMLARWGKELLSDPYYHPQFDLTTTDFTIEVAKPDSFHTLYVQRLQEQVTQEISATAEIGQQFTASDDALSAIGVQFATFGRPCSGRVALHLRQSAQATADIAVVVADAAHILDNHHFIFSFTPIADSAGKHYFFYLTFESTSASDKLVAWRSNLTDSTVGPYLKNRAAQEGTLSFATYAYKHVYRHATIT